MYLMAVTEVKQMPKSECNRNQAHKYFKKHNICITDSDHDFVIGEIKRRYTIEYEKEIIVYDNEE